MLLVFKDVVIDRKSKFLEIVDRSIAVANDIAADTSGKFEDHTVSDALVVIEIFGDIKNALLEDTLPPSKGAGLSLTKGLSEWNAPTELYDAGKEIEDYYRDHWH